MMMKDWRKHRVLIVGAARQGLALARYLATQGAQVTLTDTRSSEQLQEERQSLSDLNIEWVLGGHPLSLLNDADLVCPSGGVSLTIPLIVDAQKRNIPLTNDSQIFLEAVPCKVIGITGSAGKTTTTTLVGRMVKFAFGDEHSWIGGNIGNPLIANLNEIQADDWAVMELSSFQLEIMTRSPQIAAVLNVTPNHLDRHITMEAYTNAKAQILRHQTPDDVAVLGRDDPGAWGLVESVQGDLISFGLSCPPQNQLGVFLRDEMIALWDGQSRVDLFPRDIVQLRGEHNLLNVLAACAIAHAAGVSPEAMRAGVEGFFGVEHRLEFVRAWGGADWYNDSIATAPERAMAAIRSFDQPLVLLTGGRDKDLPWSEFASLVRQRVDHVVMFGEAKDIIGRAVGGVAPNRRPYSVDRCDNLEKAVQTAAKIVEPGDVVLLSPGGTSFDEFRDFAERGEWFRKWVKMLP
jgi:UDP-N-acetylmuramoylalanine--D-glutamate ligase